MGQRVAEAREGGSLGVVGSLPHSGEELVDAHRGVNSECAPRHRLHFGLLDAMRRMIVEETHQAFDAHDARLTFHGKPCEQDFPIFQF